MADAPKPHINLGAIGHLDSGKSSLLGQLVLGCDGVSKDALQKSEKVAGDHGCSYMRYAWLIDTLNEERERQVTVDCSTESFDTPKYRFTVHNLPGHKDHLKNLLTGLSMCDHAILVVSAKKTEHKAAMGSNGSTKDLLTIAQVVGVKTTIVCVNKMDEVKYDEARFREIVNDLTKLVKRQVGKKAASKMTFIPINSLGGDNITLKSKNMSWYKGLTVVQAIDKLKVPKQHSGKELRLPVTDVYKIGGIGTVPTGRVETGKLTVGMNVMFCPSGKKSQIKSIEMHHNTLDEAQCGDVIGFNVTGIMAKDLERGMVVGDSECADPPKAAKSFQATINMTDHSPREVKVGWTPVVCCHTAHVACRLERIIKVCKRGEPEEKMSEADVIKHDDMAQVVFVPSSPVCVETYKDYASLGRFCLLDSKRLVGAGKITSVERVDISDFVEDDDS